MLSSANIKDQILQAVFKLNDDKLV